jgi:hypothetical protein
MTRMNAETDSISGSSENVSRDEKEVLLKST